MKLRSLVQDALYLNWALPADALPSPPAPLRYQVYGEGEEGRAFVSALLFRHRGVHLPHLPVVRFTYPQMNLRLYAVDGDGVPCVLFREMLMPWWVGPAVRWVTKQPASAARFRYPRPSRDPGAESWSWQVTQGGRFAVTARRGAPGSGEGPSLGSWGKTVRFFRERSRGYLLSGDRLRRIETEHPSVPVWPLVAEVEEAELLERSLPLAGSAWPRLHSAWLCPRIPFVFDLRIVPEVELETTMPRAAASTRSAAVSAIFRRP